MKTIEHTKYVDLGKIKSIVKLVEFVKKKISILKC